MAVAIEDRVELRLGGETIAIYEDYDVDRSVLRQPAAFSARLGWGKVAAELREKFPPKTPYDLRVGGLPIMTGELDGLQMSGPPTTLTLTARDRLAALFDHYIEDEQSFTDRTYLDLTHRALDAVGLVDVDIIADNTVNRKVQSGSRTTKKKVEVVDVIDPETASAVSTTTKVFPPTIKAEIGQTWYEFLQRQYRLAGLFLWASPEGYFVLSRPNGVQAPSYQLVHRRTGERGGNNVLSYNWQDDRTNRHGRAVAYGRAGGGKHGRKKIRGEFVDAEMAGDFYPTVIAFEDEDLRTNKEADFAVRRRIAEERREGWRLEYTVAGHTTRDQAGNRVLWTPDTTIELDDEELGHHGTFYLEGVRFSRAGQTTTQLQLMRVEDLVFAEKLF